jgi:hypothetical protein
MRRTNNRSVTAVAASSLGSAFLTALRERVSDHERDDRVVLPTGIVDAGELSRVMTALDRARDGRPPKSIRRK